VQLSETSDLCDQEGEESALTLAVLNLQLLLLVASSIIMSFVYLSDLGLLLNCMVVTM
jgi:hypothetical protein